MCAERMQRIVMAIMIMLTMYLVSVANPLGIVLTGFIVVMILIWAVTNFCPSIWMFEKIFGKCNWDK
jgi:hypothetical protein